ncbi:transcription intermediary factor 1-alpha-like [Haliotis cracherodii]|uniref:transcription intermediary factor 1-alpha-like n=1 Tax=Haliotis cracherodii TaxID=6455 RepID=UPI0039E8EB6D
MDLFPVCVVCRTAFRYIGPQPHLLPCLHPVCEYCLESTVITTLTCSACMASHDRDGTNFPLDEIVLAEVFHETAKHHPESILCSNKEDGKQAVCWCEGCGNFLCEHCERSHREVKAARHHKMQLISDLSVTGTGSQTECEEHGQQLDIYDNDCDCFICPQCFYEDHVGHCTTHADTFLADQKEHLSNHRKSISDKMENIAMANMNVDKQEKVIEQKATSLREIMKHTFSDLRTVLDQREKEMLVELDHLLDSMRNINDSRRPVLKSSETICQSLLDYINKTLLYASPSHLHKLKSSITQACESCERDEVPNVHRLESSVVFSKQSLRDLMSSVSSFGSFLIPIREDDQVDEFTPLDSVCERTLKSTIAKLQTQRKDAEEQIEALRGDMKQLRGEISRLRRTIVSLDNKALNGITCLHVLESSQDSTIAIECPNMVFDSERVNLQVVHIDNQILINRRNWSFMGRSRQPMWKKYSGTSSTSPLPSSGLVYWEVEADVELDKPLGGGSLVLEVGLCGEEVMDSSANLIGQPSSSSLLISVGDNSDTIEMYITVSGHILAFKDDVFDNDGDTLVKLKYGVLIDIDEMKICYIDNTQREILGCGHLDKMSSGTELWPIFGVYDGPRRVAMELVSGQEVMMEVWKKELLQRASGQ